MAKPKITYKVIDTHTKRVITKLDTVVDVNGNIAQFHSVVRGPTKYTPAFVKLFDERVVDASLWHLAVIDEIQQRLDAAGI